jgi:hypothetical protein
MYGERVGAQICVCEYHISRSNVKGVVPIAGLTLSCELVPKPANSQPFVFHCNRRGVLWSTCFFAGSTQECALSPPRVPLGGSLRCVSVRKLVRTCYETNCSTCTQQKQQRLQTENETRKQERDGRRGDKCTRAEDGRLSRIARKRQHAHVRTSNLISRVRASHDRSSTVYKV